MKILKALVLCFVMLTGTCFAGAESPATSQTDSKDGVFIHLSRGYEDPHRALMALWLARKMSEDKDVLVFMDIKGAELALREGKDITYGHFPSLHTSLKKLIEKGVPVMVCPACLKVLGKKPADLMEGIQLADKDRFFSFTAGRILTLDY
jgi:predicted peroxiredoxin